VLAVALAAAPGSTALAASPARHHVKASLVAASDAARPGRPLRLAIRLEMEEGWHTYWRNPGDSGLATRVRWDLPPGLEAGEIQWPYPERFATGPLVSYGYEHDVLLPLDIAVPKGFEAPEVRIAGRVSWLECQEACLPGKADLELVLPVRSASGPGPHAALFEQVERRLPIKGAGWRFSASGDGSVVNLTVRSPKDVPVRDAYFYPVTPRLLDYSRPQPIRREGGAFRLDLSRDPNGAHSERLAGVLVVETAAGKQGLEVDVPLAVRGARR
jgi:DsbC/DsbD-like thiol-disulfide interchange protein